MSSSEDSDSGKIEPEDERSLCLNHHMEHLSCIYLGVELLDHMVTVFDFEFDQQRVSV
ncbi:hypothetical protein VULLAG_LOCUS16779 [Vulpes lagopus]